MSASNGANSRFSPAFLDELRARYPLASAAQETVRLTRAGKRLKGLCPFHAEKTPSFTVFPDNHYKCFGCGAKGDVFAFVEARHGVKFTEAVEHVARAAGVPMPDTHTPSATALPPAAPVKPAEEPAWRAIMPVPNNAPPPAERELGCDVLHTYRGPAGELLFYVRRIERTDGGKDFYPLTYGTLDGRNGWQGRAPDGLRPLYGLDRLAARPHASVLVCEGEKAADAAQALFPDLACVSWMGGARAIEKADWQPLIGRRCIIWPDNDAPGHEAAAKLWPRLAGSQLLRVSDLGEGHDAADVWPDDPAAWLRDRLPPDPAPKTPLPLLWLHEIEPVLQAQDFVQGVLMERGAAVVYGESNSGKTFWTTDLALHVAAGKPWNGRRVDQGGVVYCVLEGGNGFRNRASAWRQAHADPDDPDVRLPFAAVPAAINLCDPDADTSRLIETVQAAGQAMGQPVKLVVVDTLARAMAGGNENAPDDMGALVANMDRIRAETGACVLFVHHCGKDAARGARGHSSLRAAVDTEIEVVASDTARTATVVKQRDLAKGSTFGFRLDPVVLGRNQHGEDVTTCVVSPDAAASVPARERLTEDQRGWHRDLVDAFAEPDAPQLRIPVPGMTPTLTLTREQVRAAFRRRGRFGCDPDVDPDVDPDAPLRGADRERMRCFLNKLKDKGKIGMTNKLVWLLTPATSGSSGSSGLA